MTEQQFEDARGAPQAPRPAQPNDPAPVRQAGDKVVLVPRSLWPTDPCEEQNGARWLALVISETAATTTVRFLHARTTDGRPYADERLPTVMLRDA